MSPSWWKENPFMHTKFCCLQLQPGVKPLPLTLSSSILKIVSQVTTTILCFTQIQVPAAEQTSGREYLH